MMNEDMEARILRFGRTSIVDWHLIDIWRGIFLAPFLFKHPQKLHEKAREIKEWANVNEGVRRELAPLMRRPDPNLPPEEQHEQITPEEFVQKSRVITRERMYDGVC
jgi:hypothetical protein